MYLKLSLVDELFIIKSFNFQGAEIANPENLVIKLYNKIGSEYLQITELTETSQVSRQLLTDPSSVYASIYIDNNLTKSYIKVNVVMSEAVSTYSLTYSSTYGQNNTSNTFLKRYTLSMPAWSSAFKNDVSMYSKLIQPLMLIPERIYYKTNEHLWNNLKFIESNTSRIQLPNPALTVFDKQKGKFIHQSLIKQKESVNNVVVTKLPYKHITLINTDHLTLEDFPISLGSSFNRLLLKSTEETMVYINGINKYGEKVSESIYLNDVALVTGLAEYKKITTINATSNDAVIQIFNYADCLENNTIRYPYEVSGTVTKSKTIDVPSYTYNNETSCLNSYHKENIVVSNDLEDSYRVKEMLGYQKFFVTNQEDLVVLKDGKLYTGLLRKNLETTMPIHPSNNNNSLVSVLSEDSHLDNVVEFQINTKDIIEGYGNVTVQVKLKSDVGTLYLTDDNEWVSEETYKFLNNTNAIYIEIEVANLQYASVEMEFNSVIYQASVRKDDVYLKDTGLEFDDILHDGMDLIGVKDNEYFKITLQKDYYEIVGRDKISYDKYQKTAYTIKTVRGNNV